MSHRWFGIVLIIIIDKWKQKEIFLILQTKLYLACSTDFPNRPCQCHIPNIIQVTDFESELKSQTKVLIQTVDVSVTYSINLLNN